ncbi:MAG: M14 family zinc carboxypeptidase [Bradymonadia bacterium]
MYLLKPFSQLPALSLLCFFASGLLTRGAMAETPDAAPQQKPSPSVQKQPASKDNGAVSGSELPTGISPLFRPDVETVLTAKSTNKKWYRHKRGRWRSSKRGLRPPKNGHYVYGPLKDGQIRLRFSKSGRRDGLRILFRTHFDKRNRLPQSGYTFAIKGRQIWFERIEKGRFRWATSWGRLKRTYGQPRYEVVLTMVGETVSAQVYNERTGALHGQLSLTGVKPVTGDFGVMVGSRIKSPWNIQQVSVRPTCSNVTRNAIGHPIYLKVSGTQTERWPDDVNILEGPISRCDSTTDACTEGYTYVLRTDPHGLEQLLCQGTTVTEFISRPPWKYIDDTYRATRLQQFEALPTALPVGQMLTHVQINQLLRLWHKKYPEKTQLREITKTHGGRQILAIGIGDGLEARDSRPAFLLNSGHHGNEPMSILFLVDAIRELLEGAQGKYALLTQNSQIWIVPVLNADGYVRHMDESTGIGRKNGRRTHEGGHKKSGVDLNRNYPIRWGATGERGSHSNHSSAYYRGPSAGSEPETRGMMKLARDIPFVGSISYHSGTIAILSPYTIEKLKNPEQDEAWRVSRALARRLGRHPQKVRFGVRRNLYPVNGVDQDWHRYRYGTLALLVEGAFGAPKDLEQRSQIIEYMRSSWSFFIERYMKGPSLELRVVDAAGKPVALPVEIIRMQPDNGEVWKTRCPYGLYRRYLPKKGSYTIRVKLDDATLEHDVDVGQEVKKLTLHLPREYPQTRCR